MRPRDQCLYNKDNQVIPDDKQLQEIGITMSTAKAQSPAQLGLALRYVWHKLRKIVQLFICLTISLNFRLENGEFEELELTPYSQPPDLPDVMKSQDAANGQEAVA